MLEENPVKKARTNNGGGSRRKKGEGTQAQAAAKTEKKTATKRTAASGAKKEAPKKRVSRKATQDAAPAPAILMEDRHRMIAEAAYFIAELLAPCPLMTMKRSIPEDRNKLCTTFLIIRLSSS